MSVMILNSFMGRGTLLIIKSFARKQPFAFAQARFLQLLQSSGAARCKVCCWLFKMIDLKFSSGQRSFLCALKLVPVTFVYTLIYFTWKRNLRSSAHSYIAAATATCYWCAFADYHNTKTRTRVTADWSDREYNSLREKQWYNWRVRTPSNWSPNRLIFEAGRDATSDVVLAWARLPNITKKR